MWVASLKLPRWRLTAGGRSEAEALRVIVRAWEDLCGQNNLLPYGPMFRGPKELRQAVTLIQVNRGDALVNGRRHWADLHLESRQPGSPLRYGRRVAGE